MTSSDRSRREFLRAASLSLAGAGLVPRLLLDSASAAEPALAPLNRLPRMMQNWLMRQVDAVEARANERRAALKTKADAEAYVRSARERIRACFGPMPEKTPLNARTTGTIERESYRSEKVIFESRPDFLVTANLYLPKGQPGPRPAVLVCCGHSDTGKSAPDENAVARGLVQFGYVALVFDPPGQGERLQYPAADNPARSRYKRATSEHAQTGNQQVLVGETGSAWWAWDGIRAVDYLLSRPEVDPQHVGVTGSSGGGMQTTYLCGLEPRLAMAAPSCFVTTIRRNAANELPQDTEQCLPGVLAAGLDHSDFLAAFAPRPVIIQAQERDFFDVRGSQEAFDRLQRLYTLLGHPENIQLHVGAGYHSYPQENRESTYRLFHHAAGLAAHATELPSTSEPDQALWCTATGNVASERSRTIHAFTRERSRHFARTRMPLTADALRKAARALLKMPELSGVPEFSILRNAGDRRYPTRQYATYAVATEPGVDALVTRLFAERLMSRPPRGARRAVLYVAHRSADAELRDEPLVAQLFTAEPDSAFYACDLRGIGESAASPVGVGLPFDNEYFFAAYGLMLDRPYLGQRVFDLLRVVEWLGAQGHTEVHLAGKGWGALAATFAALLSGLVVQVTLKNALRSFAEIAETEDYRWPYGALLPGVLRHFDLPDCYQALAALRLQQTEPWGAADGLS